MPFEYVEHAADVALRGIGETPEDAFVEAARAMWNLMIDLDAIAPRESLRIERSAGRLDLLLVEWLSALLAEKDISGLLFSRFAVSIRPQDGGHRLDGEAWGERLDPTRHSAKLEVKGISYLGLQVVLEKDQWVAQCVVDV